MTHEPKSTDQRLKALGDALEAHDRQKSTSSASTRLPLAPKPKRVLGPKTKIALRLMGWAFALFWVLWLALALSMRPPRTFTDFLVIPFSMGVTWVQYRIYGEILIWAVKKASDRR